LELQSQEQQHIKQGWSLLAALHCVLLPELVDKVTYCPPRIELLARRLVSGFLIITSGAQDSSTHNLTPLTIIRHHHHHHLSLGCCYLPNQVARG
jgi:hypothetical protein